MYANVYFSSVLCPRPCRNPLPFALWLFFFPRGLPYLSLADHFLLSANTEPPTSGLEYFIHHLYPSHEASAFPLSVARPLTLVNVHQIQHATANYNISPRGCRLIRKFCFGITRALPRREFVPTSDIPSTFAILLLTPCTHRLSETRSSWESFDPKHVALTASAKAMSTSRVVDSTRVSDIPTSESWWRRLSRPCDISGLTSSWSPR